MTDRSCLICPPVPVEPTANLPGENLLDTTCEPVGQVRVARLGGDVKVLVPHNNQLFFKKSENFENIFFVAEKKESLLVLPNEEISLRPELSSPPRFRIQGGSPERDERTKEILVSNFGYT